MTLEDEDEAKDDLKRVVEAIEDLREAREEDFRLVWTLLHLLLRKRVFSEAEWLEEFRQTEASMEILGEVGGAAEAIGADVDEAMSPEGLARWLAAYVEGRKKGSWPTALAERSE
jgi:hypothetical protein